MKATCSKKVTKSSFTGSNNAVPPAKSPWL